MDQDRPVLLIVVCVVAFVGGYALISRLIDWVRRGTSADPRAGLPHAPAAAPRAGAGPAEPPSRPPGAPQTALSVVEGVLAVASLLAKTPGSLTFSELGLIKEFLEQIGEAQNIPPSQARRVAVAAQTTGGDPEAGLGAFREAYGHDPAALEAATRLLLDMASDAGGPTGRKAEILDRAVTVLGTRELAEKRARGTEAGG